jgi:hypothetical protein
MSIERDGDDTTETIVAEDVEAFIDKSRLRSLFDARDKASEAIRDASLKKLQARERGATRQLANSVVNDRIAACTRAYVAECEPLLRNTESGRELLHNTEITSFHVPYEHNGKEFSRIVDTPCGEVDGREITLHGLDQYLKFDSCTVEYGETSLKETDKGIEPQPPTTTQIPLPVRLSESIFRELNDLLAGLNIGLQAETDDDEEVSFDYSDLI